MNYCNYTIERRCTPVHSCATSLRENNKVLDINTYILSKYNSLFRVIVMYIVNLIVYICDFKYKQNFNIRMVMMTSSGTLSYKLSSSMY